MNPFRILLICLSLIISQLSYSQLDIWVTSIPANTPVADDIYIAGSFNDWSPDNPDYILTKDTDGTYFISLMPEVGTVEFKFTRGSWDSVEGNINGGFQPNHSLQYDGSASTEEIQILSWEDLGGTGTSTAAANVEILDTDFYIPQLDRNRRIWLYLPPDYSTSSKTYPVLYMHDGQNLFDEQSSFAGEWQIDESLNELFEQGDHGIIVVGIDNGGAHRINEYSPWPFNYQGQSYGGEGDAYIEFIVQTLKPFIDSQYRTRSGREHTGIMGSSLGGLISHYAAIEHQDVFGKAGIFSPSYWVSEEAYNHTSQIGKEEPMRFHMIAGQNESSSMVPDLLRMENTLRNAGFGDAEINRIVHPDGAHSEWYWAREFSDAYQWLFGNLSVSAELPKQVHPIVVHPNPANTYLEISLDRPSGDTFVEMYSLDGRLVLRHQLRNADTTLDVKHLTDSIYSLQIIDNQGIRWNQRLIVVR